MRSVVQALQAGFDGLNHGLAAVASALQAAGRRIAQREFCSEHDIVALVSDEFAGQHFRLAELILVGRIDEIAAGSAVTVEDLLRSLSVRAVAPARAEIAGAQRQRRNAKAGAAEDLYSACSCASSSQKAFPPGLLI